MTKKFFIIITLLFSFISGKALAISLGDLKKTLENATEEIKKEIDNDNNQSSEKKKTDTKSDSTKKEVVKEENKNKSDNLNINLSYCEINNESDSSYAYYEVKSVSNDMLEITGFDKRTLSLDTEYTSKYKLIQKANNENTKNKDVYFFKHIKNGTRVWIHPETREMAYGQPSDLFKCPDDEAIELIKNNNFDYKNYNEYLVAKERENKKSVVYDNYKGSMKCVMSSSSIEVKNGKIVDFKTNRFLIRDIGDWKIDTEKSEPRNLLVHVKAINVIENTYEYFIFDFKNNFATYIDFNNRKREEKCQKKLEL